jgi:hypothetical protein
MSYATRAEAEAVAMLTGHDDLETVFMRHSSEPDPFYQLELDLISTTELACAFFQSFAIQSAAMLFYLFLWGPLKTVYPNTVFASHTYNLAPRTRTKAHLDFGNAAYGFCAITAIGTFNPKTCGYLILWDLRIILEFPSGYTILIPSALIIHSNSSVKEGSERYSLTSFTSGELFKFIDAGFTCVNQLPDYVIEVLKQSNWKALEEGMSTWTKTDDIPHSGRDV